MKLPIKVLALPPSLLYFIFELPPLTLGHILQWPYNLPASIKYFPEDETLVRREMDIQRRLQQLSPAGVRKMSMDEGEKFFPEYWSFGDDTELAGPAQLHTRFLGVLLHEEDSEVGHVLNESLPSIHASFPLHSVGEMRQGQGAILSRISQLQGFGTIFAKRDYSCPAGSTSCVSIGRPSSCCSNGETCQIVPESSIGDVGCCAAGETCSGSVSTCQSGYTSCPNNPGGGCCIPGYVCDNVGCKLSYTVLMLYFDSLTCLRYLGFDRDSHCPAHRNFFVSFLANPAINHDFN